MPDISTIPTATALHQQMSTLDSAIAILKTPGATVTYMTCMPPTSTDGTLPTTPVSVQMQPPISDEKAIADLATALQQQSDVIVKGLQALGYTDDTGEKPPEGPEVEPPEPEKPPAGWPEQLPWPPFGTPTPGMGPPGMPPMPFTPPMAPPPAPPPAGPPPPQAPVRATTPPPPPPQQPR